MLNEWTIKSTMTDGTIRAVGFDELLTKLNMRAEVDAGLAEYARSIPGMKAMGEMMLVNVAAETIAQQFPSVARVDAYYRGVHAATMTAPTRMTQAQLRELMQEMAETEGYVCWPAVLRGLRVRITE